MNLLKDYQREFVTYKACRPTRMALHCIILQYVYCTIQTHTDPRLNLPFNYRLIIQFGDTII